MFNFFLKFEEDWLEEDWLSTSPAGVIATTKSLVPCLVTLGGGGTLTTSLSSASKLLSISLQWNSGISL